MVELSLAKRRALALADARAREAAESLQERGLGDPPIQPSRPGVSIGVNPPPASFPEEVGAGLAIGTGLPADLINVGAGLAGLDASPRPFGGSERIADFMRNLAPVAPLHTDPETFSGQVGRGFGVTAGSAPFLGGVVAGAARSAIPVVSPFARTIAKQATTRPGRFFTAESAAGGLAEVGAVEGAEFARETGRNEFAYRIVGGLLGGFVGAAGPSAAVRAPVGLVMKTPLLGELIRRTGRVVAERFTIRGGRRAAAIRLRDVSGDPERDLAAIAAAGDLGEQTSATASSNLRLMALERNIMALDNQLADEFALNTREGVDALRESISAPAQGATAADAATFFEGQRAYTNALIDTRMQQAVDFATQRIARVGPNISETQAAKILREEVDSALDAVRDTEMEFWGLVDGALSSKTAKTYSAFDTFQGQLTSATKDDMPSVARRLLGPADEVPPAIPLGMEISGDAAPVRVHRFGGDETVKEMRGFMSKLREDAREARAAGKANTARIADGIADAVLEDLNAIEEISDALTTARGYTRDVKAKLFKQGTIGRILAKTRVGGDRVAPELTATALGGKGASAKVAFDEFNAALEAGNAARRQQGLEPREALGQDAMEQFLRNRFDRFANSGGEFKPAKAVSFLRENKELLEKFPTLKRQITEAAEARKISDEMAVMVVEGRKAADDPRQSPTAAFIKADVGAEFKTLVKSSRDARAAAKALMFRAQKDETGQAVLGLKASVYDHLIDTATRGEGLIGTRMRDALFDKRFRGAIGEILTPEEIRDLGQKIKALQNIEARLGGLPDVGGVLESIPNTVITKIAQVLSAGQGARVAKATGGGSVQVPGIFSTQAQKFMKFITNDKGREILKEAMQPTPEGRELFRTLLLPMDTPAAVERVGRILGPFLGGEASAVAIEAQVDRSASPRDAPLPPPRPLNGGPRGALESDTSVAKLGASQPLPPLVENVVAVANGQGRELAPVVLARAFIGANEKKHAGILSAFFRQMTGRTIDPQQTPWSAAFANAVLKASGIEGNGSLAARSFLEFGTEARKPRVGDIAVFSRGNGQQGHVGFYVGEIRKNGQTFVRVLGGNQSDGVNEQLYEKSRLLAYRRPPKLTPGTKG